MLNSRIRIWDHQVYHGPVWFTLLTTAWLIRCFKPRPPLQPHLPYSCSPWIICIPQVSWGQRPGSSKSHLCLSKASQNSAHIPSLLEEDTLETPKLLTTTKAEPTLGSVAAVVMVVQPPSHVWLFVTPWTAACQASFPSPSPGVCPSSCSLHQWCHPAISSSDALFPFCPQSFPASGTFPNGTCADLYMTDQCHCPELLCPWGQSWVRFIL